MREACVFTLQYPRHPRAAPRGETKTPATGCAAGERSRQVLSSVLRGARHSPQPPQGGGGHQV